MEKLDPRKISNSIYSSIRMVWLNLGLMIRFFILSFPCYHVCGVYMLESTHEEILLAVVLTIVISSTSASVYVVGCVGTCSALYSAQVHRKFYRKFMGVPAGFFCSPNLCLLFLANLFPRHAQVTELACHILGPH